MRAALAIGITLLAALNPAAAQPAPDSITLLTRAGRIAEAAQLARAALALAPDDPGASLRAGGLLVRLAQFDSAMPLLTRVTQHERAEPWQHSWARLQLARAHLGRGDTVSAREELVQVIALGAERGTEPEAAALLSKVGGHPLLDTWAVVRTVHLRVHYPPDTRVETPLAHSRQLEMAFRQLRGFFGDPPGPVDVYVWNTGQEASAVMFRALAFARPDLLLVHMRPEQSPGHELAHVFSYHAGRAPRRNRFIDEGTSVAFNLTGTNLMRDAREAARASAIPVSVAAFWAEQGGEVPELILYPVAGAFVRRLIDRGGRPAFMQLLRRQSLAEAREIYGPRLDEIIAEFERDLRR